MRLRCACCSALMLLAACEPERRGGRRAAPREVTDASVAEFCGMNLTEHAGPKAQIFVRDIPNPYWFASVRDAFAFTMLQETPKAIAAIYVNDMAQAKNWDQPEAGDLGRGAQGQLRHRQPPAQRHGTPTRRFRSAIAAAARAFAAANGGRVVGFDEMPQRLHPRFDVGRAAMIVYAPPLPRHHRRRGGPAAAAHRAARRRAAAARLEGNGARLRRDPANPSPRRRRPPTG